jgi:hypothetical protein
VIEDLPYGFWILDGGEKAQPSATAGAGENVDPERPL